MNFLYILIAIAIIIGAYFYYQKYMKVKKENISLNQTIEQSE
jgi:hypothetical protein